MIKQSTTWFDTYSETGDSEAAWGTLEASEPGFIFEWVSHNAWRGHAEVKAREGSEWREYTGELPGWVTGEWDDAPEGTRGSELQKMLEAIDAREVKIIFLPTSNVFSTAYSVFIK